MFEPIADLSSARILVCNDDGIDAEGLKVLERVAASLSDDVWVVAPATEQSAVAHSVTVRQPLRIHKRSHRRFAVSGTPTDSVLLAIRHILKDKRPNLVLSGVNRGSNLGDDVTYSGTIAAAMEGTLMGVPSIAFSQHVQGEHPAKWSTAEHFAGDIVRRVTAVGWAHNVLISVNFPDVLHGKVTGIEVVRQGKRLESDELTERFDPRGQPYYWVGGQRADDKGDPGTDLAAVHRGAVSIAPLCLDLTSIEEMNRLMTVFP